MIRLFVSHSMLLFSYKGSGALYDWRLPCNLSSWSRVSKKFVLESLLLSDRLSADDVGDNEDVGDDDDVEEGGPEMTLAFPSIDPDEVTISGVFGCFRLVLWGVLGCPLIS